MSFNVEIYFLFPLQTKELEDKMGIVNAKFEMKEDYTLYNFEGEDYK